MDYIQCGDEILGLQKRLISAGRLCRGMPRIEPDGIYSSVTRAAVIIFQQYCGLPVTGEADAETTEKLKHVGAAADEYFSRPEPIDVFPAGRCLSVGDSGAAVRILQVMLGDISEMFGNIPPPEDNGIYGPKTAACVSAIQRAWRKLPDGVTDIFTWNIIAKIFCGRVPLQS